MNTFLEVLIRAINATGPDVLTRAQLDGIAAHFALTIAPGASDADVRNAIDAHIRLQPNLHASSGIMLPPPAPVAPATGAPAAAGTTPATGPAPAAPITGPGPAPAPGFIWSFQKPRFGAYRWVQIPDPALVPAAPAPVAGTPTRIDTMGFAFLGIALVGLILFSLFAYAAYRWLDDQFDNNDTPAAPATTAPGSTANPGVTTAAGSGSADSPNREAQNQSAAASANKSVENVTAWQLPQPGNMDNMPKVKIDTAAKNTWFHRVFNMNLFHAPEWNGADSWFVTLNLGNSSGGNWTSMGNPGQITFRGTENQINWCLGVLTTAKWKDQFLSNSNPSLSTAINVRITPNTIIAVKTASGKVVSQATSDAGDITIIMPDSGTISICVDYATAAPSHESLVWWGPYDRSEAINTIDAR